MADGGMYERRPPAEPARGTRYLDHVTMLLRSLRAVDPGQGSRVHELPAESYIGGGSEDEFWELIGFRIWGYPDLLLGAARFARHDGAMVEHGRESLPFYLSRPDEGRQGNGNGAGAAPAHPSLEVIFPGEDESISTFLQALRDGEERPIVRVDPDRVQMAFDFRTVNPSNLEKIRPEHAHPRTTAFRTTEGHVLVGATRNLTKKLHDDADFLVLMDPVQRTARGAHALPTLVLHRAFLAAAAEAPEAASDQLLDRLLPFSSGTAVSRPLIA